MFLLSAHVVREHTVYDAPDIDRVVVAHLRHRMLIRRQAGPICVRVRSTCARLEHQQEARCTSIHASHLKSDEQTQTGPGHVTRVVRDHGANNEDVQVVDPGSFTFFSSYHHAATSAAIRKRP